MSYIFYMTNVLYILCNECLIYFTQILFFISIVVYLPALALEQVHCIYLQYCNYCNYQSIQILTQKGDRREPRLGVCRNLCCLCVLHHGRFHQINRFRLWQLWKKIYRGDEGGGVDWCLPTGAHPHHLLCSPTSAGVYVPFHWIHHRGCHNGSRRAICCLRKGSTGHLDRGVDDDDLDGAHCSWWWHPQLWESSTSPYLNPCLKLPFSYYYATFSRGVGAFQNSLSFP